MLGAVVAAAGLALLAGQGLGGYGWLGLNLLALLLAFAGIGLVARTTDAPSEDGET